jgi:hypothetical protein
MFVERFTKSQYMLIRLNAKHKNPNIYITYNIRVIIEIKARCYPKNKSMLITEKSAEIKL